MWTPSQPVFTAGLFGHILVPLVDISGTAPLENIPLYHQHPLHNERVTEQTTLLSADLICHHRASCQLLSTRVRSSSRPESKSLAGREHPATRWEEQQSQRSLASTTAASPSIHGTSCNFPTSHSDAYPALGGQRGWGSRAKAWHEPRGPREFL